MSENKKKSSVLSQIIVTVVIALLVGGTSPWWVKEIKDFLSSSSTTSSSPTNPPNSIHCDQPTTPVLVSPGANEVQPNHYYGKGKPWQFRWLDSSCEGGSIRGYRIVIKAVGATVPSVDDVVSQPVYTGDTSGTISAREWTWKVQAIDDRNQTSEWSEERPFFVGPWKK